MWDQCGWTKIEPAREREETPAGMSIFLHLFLFSDKHPLCWNHLINGKEGANFPDVKPA